MFGEEGMTSPGTETPRADVRDFSRLTSIKFDFSMECNLENGDGDKYISCSIWLIYLIRYYQNSTPFH